MKGIRKWLCALLACLLALTPVASLAEGLAPEAPLTMEAIEEAVGGPARVHTDGEGNIVFLEGACTPDPVLGTDDAARVVAAIAPLLSGDERTQFEPWRTLTDTAGNRYYVFQQMYADTTVSGGAVKVVTDAEGNMLGLVSSVESELPEGGMPRGIIAAEAEEIVLKHEREGRNVDVTILGGNSEVVVLPVSRELDMESDKEESRFVWLVYSDNPVNGNTRGNELPYLAHYVTMDGEYLYSLPTIIPGDAAGESGYDAAYVFQFMEPVNYTGTVRLSNGREQEISIDLMRDTRTGMVYLGNLERRIAVADCYEFLYNKGNVVLEASRNNRRWDDTCLLSLYNYCRAWDYYKEIGWIGGDSLGTPILILKDFCDSNHIPVDNAAYAGHYYGWQLFLSSSANDFSQCLDILGHEFTHCVTSSVMTYNAYRDDFGAINEAISDIQGNLCEKLMDGDTDEKWLLGEDSKRIVRCMSDPHLYQQPEFSWDVYYTPKVQTPTSINDRGGVHSNSSLLNSVAYRLCTDGGMALEDARDFWFAVDCSMVPGTDYAQLSQLLPWVMGNLGLERHIPALERAIDATRLRTDEMPSEFDDDLALVTLELPDDEKFNDGNWVLVINSVNVDLLKQRVEDIKNSDGIEGILTELMEILGLDQSTLDAIMAGETTEELEALIDDIAEMISTGGASAKDSDTVRRLKEYLHGLINDVYYCNNVGAGQDGHTVRMVSRPGLTIPLLLRMEMKEDSNIPRTAGLAIYTFGRWFDLSGMLQQFDSAQSEGQSPEDGGQEMDTGWLDKLLPALEAGLVNKEDSSEGRVGFLDRLKGMWSKLGWMKKLMFYEIKGGKSNRIPSTGIESVTILDEETVAKLLGDLFTEAAPAADPFPDIDPAEMSLEELTALRDLVEEEIGKR